jgi:predicted ribosome quality control (RQC) complex YloA/Tae2 family protein
MFDVLTIAAIAEELGDILIERPVRSVGLIDRRTMALGIFSRGRERYLIASVDPENSYLVWTDREPAVDAQLVTPFLLLLRKYVRGGVIAAIRQPPLERIIQVSIAKRLAPHNEKATVPDDLESDEAREHDGEDEGEADGVEDASFVHLSIEIMGRRGNIILIDDDDSIMESIKRVTRDMSRVRPILPRLKFSNPPSQRGFDPRSLSAAEARGLLIGAEPEELASKVFTHSLIATSPRLAEEILFRAVGDEHARIGNLPGDAAVAIAREARHLYEPLLTSNWRPRLYRNDDGEIVAFSAVPIGHLARRFKEDETATVLAAADQALGEALADDSPTKHAQRRARLVDAISRTAERTNSRLLSLQEQQRRSLEADDLRRKGELIYAYLWMIKPRDAALEVDGQTIPLDPNLTASENAQAYFEHYRKMRAADDQLPKLLTAAENELAYLQQLRTLATQATRFEDIEAIMIEWDRYEREHGTRSAAQQKVYRRSAPPKRTRPLHDPSGSLIYVGRSGSENEKITFEIAASEDVWLHARGVPGSHVIVRRQGGSEAEFDAALSHAAALAAYYSSARTSGTVEVDIAKRRDVRKIKGAGPGMVTYRNERTIPIRPANEQEIGLAQRAEA